MKKLFTIGHSNFGTEILLERLNKYNIEYVIDVRSMPFSLYTPQYNKDELEKYLKDNGIVYFHMGKVFGARQEDKKYYPNGYLDFNLYRESDSFIKGRESVLKGLEKYNIALMCTEKDPIDCHRTIMISRGFELIGIEVNHILYDGSLESQKEVGERLLDIYCSDRNQISLFAENNKTDEEYLEFAYNEQNKKVGYRYNTNSEGGEN